MENLNDIYAYAVIMFLLMSPLIASLMKDLDTKGLKCTFGRHNFRYVSGKKGMMMKEDGKGVEGTQSWYKVCNNCQVMKFSHVSKEGQIDEHL